MKSKKLVVLFKEYLHRNAERAIVANEQDEVAILYGHDAVLRTVSGLLRNAIINLRMLSLIAQRAGGRHGDSYR